jgi:molybdopterin-binding protein
MGKPATRVRPVGYVPTKIRAGAAPGAFRVVSLLSREAADDLGLEPGVVAIAAVKSTNVVVEVPQR